MKINNNSFIRYIRRNVLLRQSAELSSAILILLVIATICPIYFAPEITEAIAGTATASVLTYNSTSDTATVSLAVENNGPSYASSSSSGTTAGFSIETNNATGYTLNIRVGNNGSSALSNGTNNIPTIDTNGVTIESNSFGTNKWGLLPSKYNSLTNSNNYYYKASADGFNMDVTNAANTNLPNSYTVDLGLKVDYNTPAGEYINNTIVVEYIANAVNYNITYDKGNIAGTPTNMPSSQSGSVSSTNIILSSDIPVLTGYYFLGWCLGEVTTSDNVDSCSGNVYNPNGSGTNMTFGIDQTISMNTATLHAMWKMVLIINYDGNGLYFNNNPSNTNNAVEYDAATDLVPYSEFYSHTANIDDAGVETGTYASSLATKDVVTIPGASSLHMTITYDTEEDCDALYIFEGEYAGNINSGNMSQSSTGWLYRHSGGDGSKIVVDIDVPGNTATLGFYSDGSIEYWGYYAKIYGRDSAGKPILTTSGVEKNMVYSEKTVVKGSYSTPTSTVGPYRFLGWSEDANATTATYANESEVISKAPYSNADASVTLYAIYQKAITIKYNANSGTGSISDQIIYAGETAKIKNNSFTTPSSEKYFKEWNTEPDGSGTSFNEGDNFTAPMSMNLGAVQNLYAIWNRYSYITFHLSDASSIVFNGVTYTDGQTAKVKEGPYHIFGNYATKYAFSSWSTTGGSFDNINYQNTTYNASGDATVTLTGRSVNQIMQDVTSTNCTTTATPVYDNRDDTVYWIQKLPDGKCWMLDNLAFDIVNDIDTITTGNTHINADGINALKNGGVSPYSASAISSSFAISYTEAKIVVEHKTRTLKTANSTNYSNSKKGAYGAGQNKIGIYYNYCAASGGTYCYDSSSGSGNDNYDVCPAGWRLPNNSEYNNLYGSSGIGSNPTNFMNVLSATPTGYCWGDTSPTYLGDNGGYWTTTRIASDTMYYAYFNISRFNAYAINHPRHFGKPIRCVLAS